MTVQAKHPNSRAGAWRNPPPNEAAARRRLQRIAEGEAQRQAERDWQHRRVTHSTLMLPLLQTLQEMGGAAPRDLYGELIDRLGLDSTVREAATTYADGQTTTLFDRTVRWTLQEAKRQGLAEAPRRGHWVTTEHGDETLGIVQPGMLLTIFRTELGQAIAAWAEEAAAVVEPGSMQLLFSSPLFPLLKPKNYGGMTTVEWLPWMLEVVHSWLPLLTEDGSLVLHLGDVHLRGVQAYSSYIERFVTACQDELGLYKHQQHYWWNTGRNPEQEWTSNRRVNVRNQVEPLFWLSPSPSPKSSNWNVLQEYTPEGEAKLGREHEPTMRPSGHDLGRFSYSRNNGGSIPANIIVAPNSASNHPYRVACRRNGLPQHAAVMPEAVPERFVLFLTDPGDLVGDFFFGSGAAGAVAEQHGRRWIGIDRAAKLLEGASHRPEFRQAPGFKLMDIDRLDETIRSG